ncbi:hypothetical protein H0H93_007016 [Arthromyces matolae]|nr:hypothetical protein H0H93_007016 [Arthromyces matolae]
MSHKPPKLHRIPASRTLRTFSSRSNAKSASKLLGMKALEAYRKEMKQAIDDRLQRLEDKEREVLNAIRDLPDYDDMNDDDDNLVNATQILDGTLQMDISHAGGEFQELMEEDLGPRKRREDSRARKNRILQRNEGFLMQSVSMVDAYLEWNEQLGVSGSATAIPLTVEEVEGAADTYLLRVIDTYGQSNRLLTDPLFIRSSEASDLRVPLLHHGGIAASLVLRGIVPAAPYAPRIGFTIRVLELYRTTHLHCPLLTVQPFVESLCNLHGSPLRSNLASQFSSAYDQYLSMREEVDLRVQAALLRDSPMSNALAASTRYASTFHPKTNPSETEGNIELLNRFLDALSLDFVLLPEIIQFFEQCADLQTESEQATADGKALASSFLFDSALTGTSRSPLTALVNLARSREAASNVVSPYRNPNVNTAPSEEHLGDGSNTDGRPATFAFIEEVIEDASTNPTDSPPQPPPRAPRKKVPINLRAPTFTGALATHDGVSSQDPANLSSSSQTVNHADNLPIESGSRVLNLEYPAANVMRVNEHMNVGMDTIVEPNTDFLRSRIAPPHSSRPGPSKRRISSSSTTEVREGEGYSRTVKIRAVEDPRLLSRIDVLKRSLETEKSKVKVVSQQLQQAEARERQSIWNTSLYCNKSETEKRRLAAELQEAISAKVRTEAELAKVAQALRVPFDDSTGGDLDTHPQPSSSSSHTTEALVLRSNITTTSAISSEHLLSQAQALQEEVIAMRNTSAEVRSVVSVTLTKLQEVMQERDQSRHEVSRLQEQRQQLQDNAAQALETATRLENERTQSQSELARMNNEYQQQLAVSTRLRQIEAQYQELEQMHRDLEQESAQGRVQETRTQNEIQREQLNERIADQQRSLELQEAAAVDLRQRLIEQENQAISHLQQREMALQNEIAQLRINNDTLRQEIRGNESALAQAASASANSEEALQSVIQQERGVIDDLESQLEEYRRRFTEGNIQLNNANSGLRRHVEGLASSTESAPVPSAMENRSTDPQVATNRLTGQNIQSTSQVNIQPNNATRRPTNPRISRATGQDNHSPRQVTFIEETISPPLRIPRPYSSTSMPRSFDLRLPTPQPMFSFSDSTPDTPERGSGPSQLPSPSRTSLNPAYTRLPRTPQRQFSGTVPSTNRPRRDEHLQVPYSPISSRGSSPGLSRAEASDDIRQQLASLSDTVQSLRGELRAVISDINPGSSTPRRTSRYAPFQPAGTPSRLRTQEDTSLMKIVRDKIKILLSISKDKDIVEATMDNNHMTSPEVAELFERDGDPNLVLEPFSVYWDDIRCPYNTALASLFVDSLEEDGHVFNDEQRDFVMQHFFKRLDNLKKNLRLNGPRRDENDDEAADRAALQQGVALARSRVTSRRQTLFASRMEICREGCHSPNKAVWEALLRIVTTLRNKGQSSDESEAESQDSFTVRARPWRSPEITDLLRFIDSFRRTTNIYDNNRPGRPFRKRRLVRNPPDTHSKPISGLPENFYDRRWLSTQARRADLNILGPIPLPQFGQQNSGTPSRTPHEPLQATTSRRSGTTRRSQVLTTPLRSSLPTSSNTSHMGHEGNLFYGSDADDVDVGGSSFTAGVRGGQ